ncbi:MAG: translational GTPase TypA [Fibrobacterales bacterium]|nr:translational GTPase TypA [Fibrobacterales bacterium]
MNSIRNVAILAHVDHGKTTLVDKLLQQSGGLRRTEEGQDRILDNNALERERGITILSKNASIEYKGHRINIVDTPGHVDFGGQVERVLGTVEGALLIVDAWEGPMAQTRFVTKKALEMGLKLIVVINKIDRDGCRPHEALDKVFDLFCDLNASDEQLDFPHIFCSARAGICKAELEAPETDLMPLLDMIVEHVPAPKGLPSNPFLFQIATLEYDGFLGRLATGKVLEGTLKSGATVARSTLQGTWARTRVQKVLRHEGVGFQPIEEAQAGDIVSLAGLGDFDIGDTLACAEPSAVRVEPLPRIKVDPPTISMTFSINDGPLSGKSGGKFLTGTHLQDRLARARLGDPALLVEKADGPSSFKVSGRGVLHLSILIETMRREGYEFTVGAPEVICKTDENGQTLEPVEQVEIDTPPDYVGPVIEELGRRHGEMTDMQTTSTGDTRVIFKLPSRGLIGLRSLLLSLSRGYAIMQNSFWGWQPWSGDIPLRTTGSLVAKESGVALAYALWKLEERGTFFVEPGAEIYEGMIVGEANRPDDIVVNVNKGKQLTNVRASGSDDAIQLEPARKLSLEECISYIKPDEKVEVTPNGLRLRKTLLSELERKRRPNSRES